MADILIDGKTKVTWLTTVPTDVSAPETSDLIAGLDLECFLAPDGVAGFEPQTGEVDNSKLCTVFNTKSAGKISFSGTSLTFFKQSGTDDAYDTLTYQETGAIAIRRYVDVDQEYADGDEVSVFPVQCGETIHMEAEQNEAGTYGKFQVPLTINAEPDIKAVAATAT